MQVSISIIVKRRCIVQNLNIWVKIQNLGYVGDRGVVSRLFPKGEFLKEHRQGVPLVEWQSLHQLIGFKILLPLRAMKKKLLLCGVGVFTSDFFLRCLNMTLKKNIFYDVQLLGGTIFANFLDMKSQCQSSKKENGPRNRHFLPSRHW